VRKILRREPVRIKTLFIINDPPYGTERAYNALRLAISLAKREGQEVGVFLMGDAASCAKAGQSLPNGYYNLERMLKAFHAQGGVIGVCTGCMDARGLREVDLVEGALRANLEELTDWTVLAEKDLVF
jgi:uncharacterized protein involved in oxidation of intracellular sulfur